MFVPRWREIIRRRSISKLVVTDCVLRFICIFTEVDVACRIVLFFHVIFFMWPTGNAEALVTYFGEEFTVCFAYPALDKLEKVESLAKGFPLGMSFRSWWKIKKIKTNKVKDPCTKSSAVEKKVKVRIYPYSFLTRAL